MNPLDLSKQLKPFKKGWVALDRDNKVIDHASSFSLICMKINKKKDITLVPASSNYFGFVTVVNA